MLRAVGECFKVLHCYRECVHLVVSHAVPSLSYTMAGGTPTETVWYVLLHKPNWHLGTQFSFQTKKKMALLIDREERIFKIQQGVSLVYLIL